MASKGSGERPSAISFAPENQQQLLRGVTALEKTLGPTLGPAGHAVACARIGRPGEAPELLTDGATIARRMTGLPDRFGNMGFMTARHVAWRMRIDAHDGAATAVVLLAAAYRELLKIQTAGVNRVELTSGVHHFIECALASIDQMASPLASDEMTRFASAMAGDPRIAAIVCEALTVLGSTATIVTRASTGREITLECIEGALWESTAVISPMQADNPKLRLVFNRPRIVLWDGDLNDPRAFAMALGRLREDGARTIVTIARSFSRETLALVHANASADFQLLPVIAPHDGAHQESAFGDLSALTGSHTLNPAAGDSLERMNVRHAGTALRLSAGARFLNIMALDNRAIHIGRRLQSIRQQMTATEDDKEWKRLQLRLGRLQQGMGVIWVGAPTESERDNLLEATDRCLDGVRSAGNGVVPGGGKSLLEVAAQLTGPGSELASDPGAAAIARASFAPARWLAKNGGFDPGWSVATACTAGSGMGINALSGDLVNLRLAGIVDSAETTKLAMRSAFSTAALLCDCGVLIQRPISLSMAEIRP